MDWVNNIASAIIMAGSVFSSFLIMAKFENFKYNPLTWLKKKFSEVIEQMNKQNDKINDMDEKLDKVISETEQNRMELLEVKIYLKDLPAMERYKAAREYLDRNGNHGTDVVANELIKEYSERIGKTKDIL